MLTWRDVPGYFDFNEIYAAAVVEAPVVGEHFVEVGVLFGKSALFMADTIRESGKQIAFDAVDKMSDESRPGWRQEFARMAQELSTLEARAAAGVALAQAREISDISRWYAQQMGLDKYINFQIASGQFRSLSYWNDSLGLVFIDSDHSYTDTKALIEAYLPKVRTGKILAGHDYNPSDWPEVVKAVNELLWNKFKLIGGSWIARKQGPVKKTYIPW